MDLPITVSVLDATAMVVLRKALQTVSRNYLLSSLASGIVEVQQRFRLPLHHWMCRLDNVGFDVVLNRHNRVSARLWTPHTGNGPSCSTRWLRNILQCGQRFHGNNKLPRSSCRFSFSVLVIIEILYLLFHVMYPCWLHLSLR
jgi:hypothetical protein